jgi:integration host factor subunit beta
MTKSDLIEAIANRCKMPWHRATVLVETIFDCMEASLRQGEKIELRGFGTFQIRNYRGYTGRNPRTGKVVEVGSKRLPFFKVGKDLARRVNNDLGDTGKTGHAPSAPVHRAFPAVTVYARPE